jgi:hypothetical protein
MTLLFVNDNKPQAPDVRRSCKQIAMAMSEFSPRQFHQSIGIPQPFSQPQRKWQRLHSND